MTNFNKHNFTNNIHIVFGPTASGKSDYAVSLAKKLSNAHVINADSMQIYCEVPILSNQPTLAEKQNIPHHLFGYRSITEKSNLQDYITLAVAKIKELQGQGATPILVGGTGMYLKSIVNGYAPIPDISDEIYQKIENLPDEELYSMLLKHEPTTPIKSNDFVRLRRSLAVFLQTGNSISFYQNQNQKFFEVENFTIHFVNKPRDFLYKKINTRFSDMITRGALDEAVLADEIFQNSALSQDQLNKLPAYKTNGLRELIEYKNGNISLAQAIEKSSQASRNYAKRQLTWWRGWLPEIKTSNIIDVM